MSILHKGYGNKISYFPRFVSLLIFYNFMATFKIMGAPIEIDASTDDGRKAAEELLKDADSRHASKLLNICELTDGELVTFAGLRKVPCQIDGKEASFPCFALKGETSGKTFFATEKVFKSRSKIQPLAESGILTASGVVSTATSPTQLYDLLKASGWKCKIVVKRDYYSSGVEMMSRFVGTEPLT